MTHNLPTLFAFLAGYFLATGRVDGADIVQSPLRLTRGGTAEAPAVFDGKGRVIDLGTDVTEHAWTIAGDAWAYPYFSLPQPIDPKVFSGLVLKARVLKKASNNMLILVEGADRREIWASDLYAADGQWHSVYVPFDQLRYHTAGMQNEPLRIDRITDLSLGLVSRELSNTLEVSDLILVGKRN